MVTNRVLDRNEVDRLLQAKERSGYPGSNAPKWPTDNQKKELAAAVKSGKDRVELDGREFTIAPKNRHGEVFVKPKRGFNPCGVFNVNDLLREYG